MVMSIEQIIFELGKLTGEALKDANMDDAERYLDCYNILRQIIDVDTEEHI